MNYVLQRELGSRPAGCEPGTGRQPRPPAAPLPSPQVTEGEPGVMWLSGLHIPESYLTALVQATCRRNGWPLDRSTLFTQVTKFQDADEVTEHAGQGTSAPGGSLASHLGSPSPSHPWFEGLSIVWARVGGRAGRQQTVPCPRRGASEGEDVLFPRFPRPGLMSGEAWPMFKLPIPASESGLSEKPITRRLPWKPGGLAWEPEAGGLGWDHWVLL